MILDNLFSALGGATTSLLLFGVIVMLGGPALRAVACPTHRFRRLEPRR
jgi:hypothetical protein